MEKTNSNAKKKAANGRAKEGLLKEGRGRINGFGWIF
jgi:hypothetical protein